ncbi:LamG domain-containing protein [Caulobacter sp. 1776]|uniref:LamG domain-containing protein n=1 Tax=Caulobacter sp. 1776 TaxID=3156420 RepID=UPI003392022C
MTDTWNRRAVVAAGAALVASPALAKPKTTTWTFDRLSKIGGVATHVDGDPRLVDSPYGKAVQFDGVDDRLVVDRHPLAGAERFTFEALFRPDGGAFAQRWFHLAEDSPAEGPPSNTRMLFEIRVKDDSWWLDTFVTGPGYKQTLIFPDKVFPIGHWYAVAQSYDGKTYRCYVDGVLQGEAEIAFKPQGAGKASIGARMNQVDYFKGAVRAARFSRTALAPAKMLSAR